MNLGITVGRDSKNSIILDAYFTLVLTTAFPFCEHTSLLTCPWRLSFTYTLAPTFPTHWTKKFRLILLWKCYTYLVPWFFSTVFLILQLVHQFVVVLSLMTLIHSADIGCFHKFAIWGKMKGVVMILVRWNW